MKKRFRVHSIGQISEADIKFGDLTIMVGPQATGKSILFQLFKLTQDAGVIKQTIKKHGFDWHTSGNGKQEGNWKSFLSLYFGEGMDGLWTPDSKVVSGDTETPPAKLLGARATSRGESVFLIPAQRVLILKNGWPRSFMDYSASDPFCVRSFSEHIRQLMEAGLGTGKAVFPQENRLKKVVRDSLDESVFGGATVKLDVDGFQKRLVLEAGREKSKLPYMTWSAGQREFMPLLLGLYWLMPPAKTPKKKGVNWVIVEEPEMGLHPKAIFSFMLMVMELLFRGYRVILSTHSPTVLDFVWALSRLKQNRAGARLVRDLFGLTRWYPGLEEMFQTVLEKKEYKTYYFGRENGLVTVKDISDLDPGSADSVMAGWGGLSEYSGRAADVVAESVHGAHE